MVTPVDCPYFYADYHRGRAFETCRLIERNPDNRRPWRRSLCSSCPVPGILRETTCPHLALEASVVRRYGLFERVAIFAVCTRHLKELADPRRCPDCQAESGLL